MKIVLVPDTLNHDSNEHNGPLSCISIQEVAQGLHGTDLNDNNNDADDDASWATGAWTVEDHGDLNKLLGKLEHRAILRAGSEGLTN